MSVPEPEEQQSNVSASLGQRAGAFLLDYFIAFFLFAILGFSAALVPSPEILSADKSVDVRSFVEDGWAVTESTQEVTYLFKNGSSKTNRMIERVSKKGNATVTTKSGGTIATEGDVPFNFQIIALPLAMLAFVLFFPVMDCSPWQGTPGKRIKGLRVVDRAGNRIGLLRAIFRLIAKIVSVGFIFGIIPMLGSNPRPPLHDRWSGTKVVRAMKPDNA